MRTFACAAAVALALAPALGGCGEPDPVWIVVSFDTERGPAQISFTNVNVPDATLAECEQSLPRIKADLQAEARWLLPVNDAELLAIECIQSAGDPLENTDD